MLGIRLLRSHTVDSTKEQKSTAFTSPSLNSFALQNKLLRKWNSSHKLGILNIYLIDLYPK